MKRIEKMFKALGTLNIIQVVSENDDIKNILDSIEQYVLDMDDKLSIFKENSEASLINNNAGIKPVIVSKDTFELIKLSKEYSVLTEGMFDITVKPLVNKNNKKNFEQCVNFRDTLGYTDYNSIILNETMHSVMLEKAGQGMDFGAIAKGYIMDRIIEIFKYNFVENGTINLGGTTISLGNKTTVGIRNPFKPLNESRYDEAVITFESIDEIVVTSGLYEQGNHIINPKTGEKVSGELISATIIGNNGAMQDAIATACFGLGIEKCINLLKRCNLGGVFIFKDGRIFATEDMIQRIHVKE